MGLNTQEYSLIVELIGREPSLTELGMFAVMWSEHCGYKYSRPVLSYFKKYKEAMEGSGLENAGVVEIGDGLGITMKVESHNHPSAVEPYQGAATGVGGIIRDILTMGARPIACLNSLRFGPIQDTYSTDAKELERNRYLFEHVVRGIAGYGNCVGVPTVAGEINFHPRYSGNPLVNAMCVGILKTDEITTAAASGVGNPVIYLGSSTGKDGIHGATFASDALGEDSDAKRPNVQIGDPFAEKLVIEATLEALATGAIVAIQDMGAAGLTCSTVEMASKGGVGMEINLDLVPMREDDMTAYELMLSESQERMMAVAQLGREQEVLDVFHKWGLKAVVVGHVTEGELLTVRRWGKVEAQINPKFLTDFCPTYETDIEIPQTFVDASTFDGALISSDPTTDLFSLLSEPDIASKRWVYEQYDQQVQTQTTLAFGDGDAAVIAPRGTHKGLSLKIDGNARWTFAHPYRGGLLAVCEAARNVACTGAKPVAVTDGLNFGNPTYPHVYWQFSEAVKGIADAAEALGTPVISGNVSFYNQSDLGEVLPTPLIGMLGILESADNRLASSPSEPCELCLLQAKSSWSAHLGLGASSYLQVLEGRQDGHPEEPDLHAEVALANLLVKLAETKAVLSAHDVSDGGTIVSLAEIALSGRVAVTLPLVETETATLFGEFPGYVIVGTNDVAKVQAAASEAGIACSNIGSFENGAGLKVQIAGSDQKFEFSGTDIRNAFEGAIPSAMSSVY